MINVGDIHWDTLYEAYFRVSEIELRNHEDWVLTERWSESNRYWCGRYSCEPYYIDDICRPVGRLEALVVLGIRI